MRETGCGCEMGPVSAVGQTALPTNSNPTPRPLTLCPQFPCTRCLSFSGTACLPPLPQVAGLDPGQVPSAPHLLALHHLAAALPAGHRAARGAAGALAQEQHARQPPAHVQRQHGEARAQWHSGIRERIVPGEDENWLGGTGAGSRAVSFQRWRLGAASSTGGGTGAEQAGRDCTTSTLPAQALSPQTEGLYYVVLPNNTLTQRRRLASIALGGISAASVIGLVAVSGGHG